MECKKNEFELKSDVTFLNGAYMSPMLIEAKNAGIEGLCKKLDPSIFQTTDFFEPVNKVRSLFSRLVRAQAPEQCVLIPSASYGLSNVANNIPLATNSRILLLEEQFPSNFYIWDRKRQAYGCQLDIIKRVEGMDLTSVILERMQDDCTVVSLAPLSWGDGTLIDLAQIGKKALEIGAYFILDGTQAVGAIEIDVRAMHIDALIVSAYKWLLGPYGTGCAFMSERFNNGTPLEESWLNRIGSDDFQNLTNYQQEYREGAQRYEVGEAPDFIKLPMLEVALNKLLDWQPKNIQGYCKELSQPFIDWLLEHDFKLLNKEIAYHLFGVIPPKRVHLETVKSILKEDKISVSFRKNVIRISPNVYNDSDDFEKLKFSFQKLLK